VDVDITGIALSWAPAAIGGSGSTEYGVALHSLAGFAEFWSIHGGTAPRLTIDYTSSPPNQPTVTQPAGKSANPVPTYQWTATHPDGAAITSWELEDRPAGGGVDYAKAGASGIASGTVTYTADTALAAGPRECRARVLGGGLWSAWSA